MTKHVMAFIYIPKIPYVRSGLCTQTIRLRGKRPKKVGDTILIHDWKCKKCGNDYMFYEMSGTKYKLCCPNCLTFHSYKTSVWSSRLNVEIIKLIDIGMNRHGVFVKDLKEFLDYIKFESPMMNLGGQDFLIWNSKPIDKLAKLDYIRPATGIEMGKLFNKMYDLSEVIPLQIINWKILEEK